jgi:hypothetical protein
MSFSWSAAALSLVAVGCRPTRTARRFRPSLPAGPAFRYQGYVALEAGASGQIIRVCKNGGMVYYPTTALIQQPTPKHKEQ